MKKRSRMIISLSAVCAMLAGLAGCTALVPMQAQAADLMADVEPRSITGTAADEAFLSSQMRLTANLLRACATASEGENVLISPLSIQLALAITANGAAGDTLTEMAALLGGDLSVEQLNDYLYAYVQSLPSEEKAKLAIANSIWFRDDADRLTVEPDFLQTNADYYGAAAYKAPFDGQTVKDINNWVKQHTDGMIDAVLDEVNDDAVLYLINALVFDAEWETVYYEEAVYDGTFTAADGTVRTVSMMHSEEGYYLDDGSATGFIKHYKGGYSFAALLPDEGVDIGDYVAALTGEGLQATLNGVQYGTVYATLPKFSSDYSLLLNDVLAELGMPTAFDGNKADFSGMATSTRGNISISKVLHKTFISVDERGTKAGAATMVEATDSGSAAEPWVVTLDRPFVYMILDNATKLPVFIGTVMDIAR